jgi:hypothetical protein
MTRDEKTDLFTARAQRVALLSDKVFGAPNEMDAVEAEELLRAANIDPQELKERFHARFDALAKKYAAKGQRVPPLLKQALADFRPGLSHSRAERELAREAQTSIRQLLKQAKQLPQRLANLPSLTLAAAYRNKKELSEQDKKLLDEVAEDLQSRGTDRKRSQRGKGRA